MMKVVFRIIYNFFRFMRIRLKKDCNVHKIESFSLATHFQMYSDSKVCLGRNILSDGRCRFYVDKNATLNIGDGVYFNDGFKLSCKEKITIKEGCLFGPDVKIYDNNHQFSREDGVSFSHNTEEISIGEHCWIAANVIILKGTHIGKNCVIGAGCVVSGNIPPYIRVTQKKELIWKEIR